jgi:hypothetical protein
MSVQWIGIRPETLFAECEYAEMLIMKGVDSEDV